VKQSLLIQMYC